MRNTTTPRSNFVRFLYVVKKHGKTYVFHNFREAMISAGFREIEEHGVDRNGLVEFIKTCKA